MDLHLGQKVRLRKIYNGLEGIITKIIPYDPENPISLHGTIEIRITKSVKDFYGKVGDLEHFSHYKWEEDLEPLFYWSEPREPTEDDKLIMYIVVKESLHMSVGKIAAQTGHAVQLLIKKYNQLQKADWGGRTEEEINMTTRYELWDDHKVNDGFTKILCKADDKQWEKLKEIYNPIVVKDAGKTEVIPGSETVMALFPMYKDEREKVLKRLRLL